MTTQPRSFPTLQAGAILAALGIGLGAFGAHALKTQLDAALLADYETGVRYQMYAALALIALGSTQRPQRAGLWLTLGAVIFSGSLYVLALTGVTILGAITPVGGVLLIAGFMIVALDARRT
ncbi:DUF423 domain-containing protein [Deinococcus sp. KSM4-11]|uniref:DUF423 domain-containing protein n=1 Tax=Deinococcus sp. KSM4-11 TaxID=2568654 RepID=UPI0010A3C406|nr:DUF423 domain-containing protein [Deinococcus sp. KSM4-11]THF88807.1 DUF423 domain-containing protein [Deinococcus sp. KSM4-11]